jgi:tetratricopeptide (TPR) repeat protein
MRTGNQWLDEAILQMQLDLIYLNTRRNHRSAPVLGLRILLAVAILGPTLLPANPAQAATRRVDKREIEARQAFASGRYQEALDLYAQLYADKVHPTFLRNIGRCYQNLRQPDKAINAFRDYLRQAKDVTPAERSEIEGYIAEMEAMKKQQEAVPAGQTNGAVQPQTTQPPAVPTVAPVDPNAASATTTVQLSSQIPEPPPPATPFYKKGWFWGAMPR